MSSTAASSRSSRTVNTSKDDLIFILSWRGETVKSAETGKELFARVEPVTEEENRMLDLFKADDEFLHSPASRGRLV